MRSADIIPILSRRRPPSKTPAAAIRTSIAAPNAAPIGDQRAGRWIVATMIACVVAVIALFLLAGDHDRRAVNRIEASERPAIFQRAQQDINETCHLPEATREPLRQHCLNQAAFVLLFPECEANCQRQARELLPHVSR